MVGIRLPRPHHHAGRTGGQRGNPADLLSLLGLTGDSDGLAAAEDFLGRVLLAQALLDATIDDEHGRPGFRDGNWIECGRHPGSLADRLAHLHEIATWAISHHTVVAWS
jgi:hypothetical protein